MKKLFTPLCACVLLFASCVTSQKPLYVWGNYGNASYAYVKDPSDKTTEELMEVYRKLIEGEKGSRQVPPPGIYADYGYMLIMADRAEEGQAMLEKEMEIYPESQVFVKRILSMTKSKTNEK